jgi:hypothetical protein
VAFHVLLAQGQLELDRVEQQIKAEQELYPKKRLELAQRASPEAIKSQAAAQGLVEPSSPAAVVIVPADPATQPPASDTTSTTDEYEEVKQHLDPSP